MTAYRDGTLQVHAAVSTTRPMLQPTEPNSQRRSPTPQGCAAGKPADVTIEAGAKAEGTGETQPFRWPIRASGRPKILNPYKLLLTVKDASGTVLEVIPQNVGFPLGGVWKYGRHPDQWAGHSGEGRHSPTSTARTCEVRAVESMIRDILPHEAVQCERRPHVSLPELACLV